MSENLPENTHEHVQWQLVDEVPGDPQAEFLSSLLEAQGVPVILSQEGYGRAMGLMGTVQILVPGEHADFARQIIDDYYKSIQNEETGENADSPSTAEDDFS